MDEVICDGIKVCRYRIDERHFSAVVREGGELPFVEYKIGEKASTTEIIEYSALFAFRANDGGAKMAYNFIRGNSRAIFMPPYGLSILLVKAVLVLQKPPVYVMSLAGRTEKDAFEHWNVQPKPDTVLAFNEIMCKSIEPTAVLFWASRPRREAEMFAIYSQAKKALSKKFNI